MCGIFGFISGPKSNFEISKFDKLLNNLFVLSRVSRQGCVGRYALQ